MYERASSVIDLLSLDTFKEQGKHAESSAKLAQTVPNMLPSLT
jgi:hypothetical protein